MTWRIDVKLLVAVDPRSGSLEAEAQYIITVKRLGTSLKARSNNRESTKASCEFSVRLLQSVLGMAPIAVRFGNGLPAQKDPERNGCSSGRRAECPKKRAIPVEIKPKEDRTLQKRGVPNWFLRGLGTQKSRICNSTLEPLRSCEGLKTSRVENDRPDQSDHIATWPTTILGKCMDIPTSSRFRA